MESLIWFNSSNACELFEFLDQRDLEVHTRKQKYKIEPKAEELHF